MFSCLTCQQLPWETVGRGGHLSWRSSLDDLSRQKKRTVYGDADLMTLPPPDSGRPVPSTDDSPTEKETIFKLQPLLYEPPSI